jgi:hypothetical protein
MSQFVPFVLGRPRRQSASMRRRFAAMQTAELRLVGSRHL